MTGHGQKLSRYQEKAIGALLCTPTIPAAAKAAGVSESTLTRWLRLDSFQSAFRDARKEVVSRAMAKVQSAMSQAVDSLQTIMTDPEAPPSARVSAARAVLDLGIRAVEIEDFEERLQTLEKMIREK